MRSVRTGLGMIDLSNSGGRGRDIIKITMYLG